ncbi:MULTISPECIES: AAA family ATPase [unclassified Bradyrhizobium]|uniref:AAA family ATPase n=1 Tax=unclassified Bradyrhizobium TaxID=2631580 RepID=UPI0033988B48
MSADDPDEVDLPAVERDAVVTGAAADSADWDARHEGLPRLLRYAMLVNDNANHVEQRLIAEIDQLCPNLPLNAAWATAFNADVGLALATELDRRAVTEDDPKLRGLADSVRLLSLPASGDGAFFRNHHRVAKALLLAFSTTVHKIDEQLRCDVERFVFGWAALPACGHMIVRHQSSAMNAVVIGSSTAKHRIAAAKKAVNRKQEEEEEAARKKAKKEAAQILHQVATPREVMPEHHLVVARMSDDAMKSVKLKEILGPLKNVINVALPLVEVPPLHQMRSTLLFEFPYAMEVIDFALADLVGRTTVRLRPLLLVGDPGAGKSRFSRRLGEVLGLNVWRENASRADGAAFGGTDRRWYSAEPCHPFLAVAQGKTANPMVLLDELERAATRSDYGRLWDCLLGFLETETSTRYPDPALQTNLDLSHVSYVATANSLDPLPSAIRDRFRVVLFPKPRANDLGALLPTLIADLAKERGLDEIWMPPLDGAEYAAVARNWRGGSVRRLRRVIEAIMRQRDLRATRN